jgi:hypothetical protein
MVWGHTEAERLLGEAFPWGAHVTVSSDAEFVSLKYWVVEGSADADGAELFFVREPGNTFFRVSEGDLRAAGATGVLETPTHWVRRPEPEDVRGPDAFEYFIRPQSRSDSKWVARMRLHQSWWRTFRLRVPFGFGPNPRSTKRYGNMLDDDGALRGLNFVSDEARRAFAERLEAGTGGVDPWRTGRNLLASQPLAFNVFGHLRYHLDLATGLFRALLGDEVEAVTSVEVERLSDALGDKTAFDAFATYRRPGGSSGSIAIETKLSEPFSQKAYEWARYVAHPAFDPTVFVTDDVTTLGDRRWSQLWRNHMLALAESKREPRFGRPHVFVIHHPNDPHCAKNVSDYCELLAAPSSVKAVDLSRIQQTIGALVEGDTEQEEWVAALHDRYLDLDLSEPLRG